MGLRLVGIARRALTSTIVIAVLMRRFAVLWRLSVPAQVSAGWVSASFDSFQVRHLSRDLRVVTSQATGAAGRTPRPVTVANCYRPAPAATCSENGWPGTLLLPVHHDVLDGPATARGPAGFPARAPCDNICASRSSMAPQPLELFVRAPGGPSGPSQSNAGWRFAASSTSRPRRPDSYGARAAAPRCSYGSMLATGCTTGDNTLIKLESLSTIADGHGPRSTKAQAWASWRRQSSSRMCSRAT